MVVWRRCAQLPNVKEEIQERATSRKRSRAGHLKSKDPRGPPREEPATSSRAVLRLGGGLLGLQARSLLTTSQAA